MSECDSEDEGEFIPYEPEEPEEALKFIQSIITLLIERVIPEKPKPLTLEKAGKCLKILGKIWNLSEYPPPENIKDLANGVLYEKLMDMEGYVDEYQFLHIEAVDLGLSDVKILPQHFIWLLSADLSGNRLTNETACPVTKLPNLVALRLNRNRVEDPYLPAMKHLQYLGLNSNKIKSLHRIYHPNLETLDVNYNLIQSVEAEDCWKLSRLTVGIEEESFDLVLSCLLRWQCLKNGQLELRGNQLTTTSGIEYSTLVNLYLAQNQITKLEGLEILVNLQRLHLRENPLSDLSGFSELNENLTYLNIRKCQVETVEDIKNLSVLKGLKELIVKGNQFNPEPEKKTKEESDEDDDEEEADDDNDDDENPEDDELRLKILTYIPTLIRIDKKLVSKEEKESLRDLLDEDQDY